MINVLQTIFSIPYVSVDEATNKTRLLLLTFILLSVCSTTRQEDGGNWKRTHVEYITTFSPASIIELPTQHKFNLFWAQFQSCFSSLQIQETKMIHHQMCGLFLILVAGGLPLVMPAFLNSYSKIFMHFLDRQKFLMEY